jgi:hypothetical protein
MSPSALLAVWRGVARSRKVKNVNLHPLIELGRDREVKQAKGFKAVAATLTGEILEAKYLKEVENAPKRHDADKKYLDVKTVRIPTGPQAGKESRHLAMAIGAWTKQNGGELELPGGDKLTVVDALVPLRTAAPDKAKGDDDPNKGVEDMDLLALLPDDRAAVVCLKYLAPDANRGGAGDTPLRTLLEGLAQVAMVDANRDAVRSEILDATGRTTSDEAPALIIAASPRYWEICRKREAQKGAAWIRELERLGREVAPQIGVEVFFYAIELEGETPWSYEEDGPLLANAPDLEPAWEAGAGKLKPKPKSRAKKNDGIPELVEADLSIPPRAYGISETYAAGERIEHVKLGTGVVQGILGKEKILVLFGEDSKLLVHERGKTRA